MKEFIVPISKDDDVFDYMVNGEIYKNRFVKPQRL